MKLMMVLDSWKTSRDRYFFFRNKMEFRIL